MQDLFWIINLIRRLRPDLCRLFPTNQPVDWWLFINWLAKSGVKEYLVLAENEQLAQLINKLELLQSRIYSGSDKLQQQFPFPERHDDFLRWFYSGPMQKEALWGGFNDTESDFLNRIQKTVTRLPLRSEKKETQEGNDLPLGINLIGYAFGQLGIGEDLRMAAKALQAIGIPFTIYNFPPGKDIQQNDKSMEAHVSNELKYSVSLFCMTALEQGRFYVEKGQEPFEARYNIGYWPWELSNWPDEWRDLTCLVDEVWVSTRHTYDALAPVSPVPVLIMPMAVELGEISSKTRADFGLPDNDKLFCFSFDLNSTTKRKNPLACVNAFLKAFPADKNEGETPPAGLVIKAHKPRQMNHDWEYLKLLAAQDQRLHIIESTLSRPDVLALYQACDCFVSLHRAEGFGRGIAEALQLGLDVITTGYSGNVDFCQGPQAHLVDYQLIEVNPGEYPYGEGQLWADASTDHAAELMYCFASGEYDSDKALRDYPEFSFGKVGARYVQRLSYIRKQYSR